LRQSCREYKNNHFVYNNFFPPTSCRLGRNVEEYGRARTTTDENIIWRMRIACFTRSEYVIIIALPQQQLLRQFASVLRCTYLTCLVWFLFVICGLLAAPTLAIIIIIIIINSQPLLVFKVRITYHVVHIHYSAKKSRTIWRVLSMLLSA